MDIVSGQGSTFTWGTSTFLITSVQVSASNDTGGEIDITSMSSEVIEDTENSGRKLIVQDFDACFSKRQGQGTELSVEFYASTDIADANYFDLIGSKRDLLLQFPRTANGEGVGFTVRGKGLLTSMQLGVSAGDFVKGSATFRMSGQ